MWQQVAQETTKLVELQQEINILCQQEQTQDHPNPQPLRQVHHHQQLLEKQQTPFTNEARQQPPSL
jgi:hypothetical protein